MTLLVRQNIKSGVSGVGEITHFDATEYGTKFAAEVKDFDATQYIDKKETKKMDRLFVRYCCRNAGIG